MATFSAQAEAKKAELAAAEKAAALAAEAGLRRWSSWE